MTAVFRHSKSKLCARLVLLALADIAADDGQVTAYARSHSFLAKKCNCDQGSVSRAIEKLVELGELEVLEVGDGRSSSCYRLHVIPVEAPQIERGQNADPGPARRAPRGGQSRTQGGQDALPIIPSLSDISHPSPSDTPDPFDQFWESVPHARRVGKGDARKAWVIATRSADPAEIIAGMVRYADETKGREPRFLKTPGPWLRAERWLDEPGANRDRRQSNGARQQIAAHDGPAGRVVDL